jgi:WD40 repeat protein
MNATSHISNILRDLMGDSNRALAVARQSQVEAEEAAARAAGAAKKVKEVSDIAAKDIERANLELEEANAQAEEAREFLKRVQSISSNGSRRTDENDFAARNENVHRNIPERVRISIDANEEVRHQTTRHSSTVKYPQSPRKTYGAPLSPTGVKKQKSDNNWWSGSIREQQSLRPPPPPSAAVVASTTNNSSFIEPIRSFKGHTSPVTQVVAVDKYRFLSSSWDTTIRLWDADTGECTRTYCGHDDWVTAIQVLDNKHFISGSDDRCVKLWSFDAEVCIRTFTGHTSFVKSLAPIDSNRFLSGVEIEQ